MSVFIAQHQSALTTAWQRLWRTPLNTILALLVMGIALTLPAGGYVLLGKLAVLGDRSDSSQQISVFLATDASAKEVAEIESRLGQINVVSRYVSKENAWRDMQSKPGMSDVLAGLSRNPLPDAFVVETGGMSAQEMEGLRQQFSAWPRIAHVQLDTALVQRLEAILKIGRLVVTLLAVLFSVALVAITFNTIRLQVLAQATEIEVSRLIGATHVFIRRPFAYVGILQGFMGGLVAVVLVTLGLTQLQGPAGDLAALYGTQFALGGMSPTQIIGLLLGGAFLGWLGAVLSVSLSLRDIDDA
jgi:cell division transport system permease protein